MLLCPRCNSIRSGNRTTYFRCECGGPFTVIPDSNERFYFDSDGPKELFFGDDINKKSPRRVVPLSPNRKVMRKAERPGQEGVSLWRK